MTSLLLLDDDEQRLLPGAAGTGAASQSSGSSDGGGGGGAAPCIDVWSVQFPAERDDWRGRCTPNPFASTPNMMLTGFGAAAAVVLLMAIYRCCVSLLRRLVRCVRCVCWCCFRAPGGRQQRFEGVPSKEVQAPELS